MTTGFDALLPGPLPPADRHVFGTVTGVNPLRVRLDGDSVSLPMSPTTVASVRQGDRVLVLVKGLQRIVLGRVGGGPPDTGWATCTLVGDVTAPIPIQVRRLGQTVHLRGRVARAAAWVQGVTTVATLPAGYAPAVEMQAVAVFSTEPTPLYARVLHPGQIQIYAPATGQVGSPLLAASWPLG